jgi:hypothetical protein
MHLTSPDLRWITIDQTSLDLLSTAWREARTESAVAYAAWRDAAAGDRRLAFAVFLAAEDREAAAEAAFLTRVRLAER